MTPRCSSCGGPIYPRHLVDGGAHAECARHERDKADMARARRLRDPQTFTELWRVVEELRDDVTGRDYR